MGKVQSEVFKKLVNYKYPDDSAKPKRLRDIEEEAKIEKGEEYLTPAKTFENGWVVKEHIEEKDCPYAHPKEKRYKYLNVTEIEKGKLKYMGGKKGYKKKKEAVWRLKPDKFPQLFQVFYFNGEIEFFFGSDYYADNAEGYIIDFFSELIERRGKGNFEDFLEWKVKGEKVVKALPSLFANWWDFSDKKKEEIREMFQIIPFEINISKNKKTKTEAKKGVE